jgi:hypothetical protein
LQLAASITPADGPFFAPFAPFPALPAYILLQAASCKLQAASCKLQAAS